MTDERARALLIAVERSTLYPARLRRPVLRAVVAEVERDPEPPPAAAAARRWSLALLRGE